MVSMFKPVNPKVDFPEEERKLLQKWYAEGIVEKYLHLNDNAEKRYSFFDGPITANNYIECIMDGGERIKICGGVFGICVDISSDFRMGLIVRVYGWKWKWRKNWVFTIRRKLKILSPVIKKQVLRSLCSFVKIVY